MTLYQTQWLFLLLYTIITTHRGDYVMAFIQWPLQMPRTSTSSLPAHLITFDLDDTLFPVGPVIQYANKALFDHLGKLGYSIDEADFLMSTKHIRTTLAEEGIFITYSELRMQAIRREMEKQSPMSIIDQELVEEAYQVWEHHRHIGAELYLYHDTCDMLQQLKDDFNNVVIGAITNGKGNPLKMNSLSKYFDFCVSGEDKHVFPLRKPHEGIYKAALDEFTNIQMSKGIDICNDYIWIHVGDDLANDVGASAQAGAFAIWADLDAEYAQTASKRTTGASFQNQPAWSTATPKELNERKKLDEAAKQQVSATIRRLIDIPSTVKGISLEYSQDTKLSE